MNIYTDGGDIIAENFIALAKSDLLALAKELCEIDCAYSFAEADLDFEDKVPGFELEQVESDNDGDGNYMYSVVEFKLDRESLGFVRIGGTYSSWDGSEYDKEDLTVVVPKHVVTLEYIAADGSEDRNYLQILP